MYSSHLVLIKYGSHQTELSEHSRDCTKISFSLIIAVSLQHCQSWCCSVSLCYDYFTNTELKIQLCLEKGTHAGLVACFPSSCLVPAFPCVLTVYSICNAFFFLNNRLRLCSALQCSESPLFFYV